MKISDFDIWYNYTSFFIENHIDLEKITNNLLQKECAQIILSSNRKIYWNSQGKVKEAEINVIGDFHDYKITFPEGLETVKGGLEFAYQGVQMFVHSQNLFKKYVYGETFNHIRVYCSPFYLNSEDHTISLYPQIKIFSSGIIQISFRKIGNLEEDIDFENFINNYVDLPLLSFSEVWIPRGIFTVDSYYNYIAKEKSFTSNRKQNNAYSKLKKHYDKIGSLSSDEFRFNLVTFSLNVRLVV